MSVVLRCPNCGTTRATAGECEACHEAAARYFCTNHAPGLWLAEPACPTCGARFGEAPRAAPVAVPVRPVRPAPSDATRGSAPAARSGSAAPAPRRHPRAEYPASDAERDADGLELEPWRKVLSLALNARRTAIAGRRTSRPAVGIGGCLRRLLLTLVVLVIASGAAFFFFGRALLHALQPY